MSAVTLNVFCTICSENYNTNEVIWSTSCGHIFHENCLTEWKQRMENCPECRSFNPQTKRVYLNLSDTPLPTHPECSNQESLVKRISLLERKLEIYETNFFEAKLALSAAEARIQDLGGEMEIKKACLNSYDQKLQDLQNVLEESDENLLSSLGELTKTESALHEKKQIKEVNDTSDTSTSSVDSVEITAKI